MRTRKMLLYGGMGLLARLPLGFRWCEVEEGAKFVYVSYRHRKVKIPLAKWQEQFAKVQEQAL